MKKLVALLLAAIMLLSVSALAEAPEGYPEVVPGIDFEGKTVYIYAWYDQKRSEEPTEEQQARYDYEDWLMETYNVKVEAVNKYDWGGGTEDLINFVGNPDPSILCLYTLPGDYVYVAVSNNLFAPLNDVLDVMDDKWNPYTREFMTRNGKVYGVLAGDTELREGIFFNHRHLKDAGIEPETIYDLQLNGEWTFEKFEELLAQTHRDIDNDGVIDVWGMTGDRDSLVFAAIAANNAEIFHKDENGKMSVVADSPATIEALNWIEKVYREYFYKDPSGGADWAYYKEAWKQGISAFRAGQYWEAFNENAEMDGMEDDWGFVAMPKGPRGDDYVYLANDNVVGIPAIYDAETLKKIAFIYDLWMEPTPGFEEDEFAWITVQYNKTPDDRAIDETLTMLRDPSHIRTNNQLLLGNKNDLMGNALLWQLGWGNDPAALVEAAMPAWQAACDMFNAEPNN